MTTEERSTKETPDAEKAKTKRSRTKAPAQSQSEQTPDEQQPENTSANLEFGQVLQEQIAQAVQPVLAEFRQQVARAVEEQLESEAGPGKNGDRSQERASEASTGLAPQSQPEDNGTESDSAGPASESRSSRAAPESSASESAADEPGSNASTSTGKAETPGREDDAEGHEEVSSQPQSKEAQDQSEPQEQLSPVDQSPEEVPAGKAPSAPKRLLTGGLHLAEQQGERWLQSMVAAGITALLAESSKTAAQDRAEQGLHSLLAKGYEAAPAGTLSPDLQGQIERTLQTILRDTIEALFSEDVRTSIVHEASEAVGAVVHGDFGAATKSIESAAMAIVDELVRVLRRQWQRVLRLVFKAVLAALENSVDDDDDGAITSKSKKVLSGRGDKA